MTKSIVVADDSLFARMLIKEAVKQIYPDVTYVESTSGQGVLDEVAKGTEVDWFLLDVNMGEPSGPDTAKALMEQGIPVEKITLVTANKAEELQSHADEIGLNYINKAISPSDVDEFVGRLTVFFNKAA